MTMWKADATPGGDAPILLQPGRNCWRTSVARRATLLTNSHYFEALAASLDQARQRIFIIGWDFEAGLCLAPGSAGAACRPLGEFLGNLLARIAGLEIRILLWDRTIFYGGNRRSASILADLRERHERFEYRFVAADLGASHHAKLVVIDDALGFAGGIDLAGDRWDRDGHPPTHPNRVTPEGESYGPIHDVQMMVDGPAALDLADYARECWATRAGLTLPPLVEPAREVWPAGYEPDLMDVPLGIARTDPAQGIREIEALNLDALASARRSIYIEAQYLTAAPIGDMLVQRLEEPVGPEIIIIVTRTSNGFVEQFAMGNNRDRLLRRLATADRHGRLRVYYPVARDGSDWAEIKIHTKLIVIDDQFLRIGSSNLNNRSLSIDTECDLAFIAATDHHRAAIRAIRNRLLADQLRRPAAALDGRHSLIAAIEALNEDRYLEPLPALREDGPSTPMLGTALLDPEEPLTTGRLWSELGAGAAALLDLGETEEEAADAERH
jgi:phosphatidylserine/phosphatidylglycerophosphate/cardiolipin synthase-like enzyme